VDAEYRQRFLHTVSDPAIVYYWQKEFPLLSGKPQGPILTRLDTFVRPKIIRYMVSQKTDRLDFATIMNGQRILLAKPSMAAILAGARKYNLGLVLAHQELHQRSNRDSDVASAVISNPYTRVCFRLGNFDVN